MKKMFETKKVSIMAALLMVTVIGIGLISMSGAKFTAQVDTGTGNITAGVLEALEYTFTDSSGNPTDAAGVNAIFSKVYPGWSDYVDVTIKTSAATNLDADFDAVIGGGFISAANAFCGKITMNVVKSAGAGTFSANAAVTDQTLTDIAALKATYNDTLLGTVDYVSLGTGELLAAGADSVTLRLTFSFADSDAGNTAFTDMLTYESTEGDNALMGEIAAFDLVLKAMILAQ